MGAGPPGGHLACAAPADLSLVVISEPWSRSPEPASLLTAVSCCHHQPVPCPGVSRCCLSAGKEGNDDSYIRTVLSEKQASFQQRRVDLG